MNWFIFALLGYFLYSLVTISNKFLLRQRATTEPLVFTFWTCLLSFFTFGLAPFGLHWPGSSWLMFDILTGVIYFFALWAFYKALDINETSRVVSAFGGLVPIFVLVFSWWFLGEALGWSQLLAFIVLVAGGILISFEKHEGETREALKGIKLIIVTVLLHAIYFMMLKYLFESQNFVTGFIWSRLGLVVAALAILIYPVWRRVIFSSTGQATAGISSLMVGSKLAAGFGSLFVSLAVSRGPVSLVNALQGTQYVFLFLMIIFLSKKFPKFLHEKLSRAIIVQKIAAILLICGGLALIAL